MELATDMLRTERISNEDMIPKDVQGENIDVVKEQILDLNDKFDFLLSLLMKGQKLGVSIEPNQEGFNVIKDFSMDQN